LRSHLIRDSANPAVSFSPTELAERYGSWSGLRSNHVVDQNGRFFDDSGSSRGISNETDRQLLIALRAKSDAVIVDAATARSEKYWGLKTNTLAIISESGNFKDIPAVEASTSKLLLLVPLDLVSKTQQTYSREDLRVIGFDHKAVFQSIRRVLSENGYDQLLLETGPTLTNLAIREQQLSQACLTQTFDSITPTIADVRFPFQDDKEYPVFTSTFVGYQEDSLYSLWEAPASAWL
jgi:riboflavin biosynthesis pyrimidine reductase